MRTLLLTLTTCLLAVPAQAKYSGGTGEPNDPYQIAAAADLIALGETPADYDKHFILTADIDLDPMLPGRRVFSTAVIAPVTFTVIPSGYQLAYGPPFSGVFDGNGHVISRLTINGVGHLGLFGQLHSQGEIKHLGVLDVDIVGTGAYCYPRDPCPFVGGLVGYSEGSVTCCYSTGTVSGGDHVGGLVGHSQGDVTRCYSTCTISGSISVGGLVGSIAWYTNDVAQCYSAGVVRGRSAVGGLVGLNAGTVAQSYSTSAVSGAASVGGLVGVSCAASWIGDKPYGGTVLDCFWNVESSRQTQSAGGKAATTDDLKAATTFLNAGWDFVGETTNGTRDIWWILDDAYYPLLWDLTPLHVWSPYPENGARDVDRGGVVLTWIPGRSGTAYDVYFGQDANAIYGATVQSARTYCGRQSGTVCDPAGLEWGKTYYWRVDEVNEADPDRPRRGDVWSFTTIDFRTASVVDDFESYTDDEAGQAVYQTWLDGVGWFGPDANCPGIGTGSTVGNLERPIAELTNAHGGRQSMPMDYNNVNDPWYSEAERTWETPQDWTIEGADTLTLYFRAEADNNPEPLYVGIEDSAGRMAVVVHPDAEAVLATEWQKWHVALGEVRAAGVDVAAVKKMVIGVGDRKNPKPGGTGRIYIDDIRLTRRMP